MSLDLFFVHRGVSLEQTREKNFAPGMALRAAQIRVVQQLTEAFPPAQVQGSSQVGSVLGFPLGTMQLQPGCIHWSLHGVADDAPVRAQVDWFRRRGWFCVDPQDAGFDNCALQDGELPDSLQDYDELEGAQLLGLRLERENGSGLSLELQMADGRVALLRFATFVSCRLPDLSELLERSVAAVVVEPTTVGRHGHDIRFLFVASDEELCICGAIYRNCRISDH
jgi:hypothetical protein